LVAGHSTVPGVYLEKGSENKNDGKGKENIRLLGRHDGVGKTSPGRKNRMLNVRLEGAMGDFKLVGAVKVFTPQL